MTIWEYVDLGEHPWFNTDNYEPWQIAMFLIGALLWIVVYIISIKGVFQRENIDIPILAVCLNFGCEVTTAFFFVPDMGLVLVLAYWAWLVLDFFIVRGMFKYGKKQFRIDYLKNNFTILVATFLVVMFVVQLNFILTYDLPMAPLNSFIINLAMSVAFIYLAFGPTRSPHARIIAWCKFLGTGIIGVMFFTKYTDNGALTSLYVTVALADLFYLYVLYRVVPDAPDHVQHVAVAA